MNIWYFLNTISIFTVFFSYHFTECNYQNRYDKNGFGQNEKLFYFQLLLNNLYEGFVFHNKYLNLLSA
jgi:hypothetical protein